MHKDFGKIVAVVDCTLVVVVVAVDCTLVVVVAAVDCTLVVVVEDSYLKEGDYFVEEYSIDIYLAEEDKDFDNQYCLKWNFLKGKIDRIQST